MIAAAVAALIAGVAILSQSHTPPTDFAAGIEDATPIVSPDFVGLEWPCGDENCYAGLVYVNGGTVA